MKTHLLPTTLTTEEPGELITGIELPFLEEKPTRQMFRKVGTRAAQAISKVVAAGLLWLGPDGRVKELGLAPGSMAPTVRRLRAAEEAVQNQELGPAVIDTCCARPSAARGRRAGGLPSRGHEMPLPWGLLVWQKNVDTEDEERPRCVFEVLFGDACSLQTGPTWKDKKDRSEA